jgi:phage-related minor tail protein
MSGGQAYMVGERGPELVIPSRNSHVVPNNQMGGGVVVQQTFNFAANGDESVKQIIAQQAPKIAKMTQQSIMESRRRGGQMKAVFG